MRNITLLSLLVIASQLGAQTSMPQHEWNYAAKHYESLVGMDGFTPGAIEKHLKIYSDCVTQTNTLMAALRRLDKEGKQNSPAWQSIKRRVSWNWDCMRLHEYYFDNLGGNGKLNQESPLYKMLTEQYGSFEAWNKEFKAAGALPGSGYVVLIRDPYSGRLLNDRIDQYPNGLLTGSTPLLIMDVWEHAYMWDYGLDIKGYMEAFFKNIDWSVVDKRYAIATSSQQPTPPELKRQRRQ